MKRVLIVSPHFPPINAPDMQRIRMSLPHYRAYGWEPVVLAVAPDEVDAVREPELLATVPADVRVEHCGALPRRRMRRLGVGNIGQRAWLALDRVGRDLLRRERFDLVLFSNTQFITFPLGRRWRTRFGVPYVLDVQDPWRTDYYSRPGSRRPPGGWKYRFAQAQAVLLERWAFARASGVMSVSPRYVEDLRRRYPELAATPADVIRFGASRQDLEHAGRLPAITRYDRHPGEIHFVYTGAAGPILPHATTVLFEALRAYRAAAPQRAARLRFHFLGTSYVAPGAGRHAIRPLAESLGVADLVDEVPHRLGHLECLRLQADADVLLLPGSNDPAYSPSKAYGYFLSRKPVLGLVFPGSVLEALLDELGGAHVVRIAGGETAGQASGNLQRFFAAAVEGVIPAMLSPRQEEHFCRNYLADDLTRRQCALFDRAVAFAGARS